MKIKFTLLLFLFSFSIVAQSVTARLIDKSSQKPIPYANIKTGEYAGVISNDEGFFTISSEDDSKSIIISCMGYENKTLTVKDIKALNFVIELQQAINQLDEVFISNKAPNADSIIARVKAKLADNYNIDLQQYHMFKRTTDYVDFKSLEFEIDKASNVKKRQLEGVNNSLTALANQVKNSNMVQFSDFKGKVFSLNKDSIKLEVEKATELLDTKNSFSIDNIQEKMQNIILTYLDTTKTYKLKTGLFKIEDSLALNDEDFKENDKNEYTVSYLNNETKSLLKRAQFYDNAFLSKILDNDLYEYNFEDMGYNNGELTYIISYIPRKGKAKYTGKLYVVDDIYAITRADYGYYKRRRGQKFNLRLLLGVKYIENVSEGTIIFEKDSSSLYHPKYIKRTYGSYFYVSRPLKFIENSSERNKVAFDFTMEGDNRTKEELLITKHNSITFLDFQAEKQVEKIPFIKLSKYQNTIWDSEGVLEPSLEMKAFEGSEK
ncbi:carboxypeptidase-like regulatory domain-containing protein [Hyunsoonleella flava]|uniref:Carboxypeptidase-like regulatory domain-containing protein n=1 Tax=Hyunsoonleella flava TaxID=2527939 RepID=A0A4Q9FGQ8_9FLAO|nr:carboxypeptidase-like regulatory domain-containing protein [Hyunsoonleella flava]TBM99760.1 carboxypeptidase-like regulatory domain-containing protein [Hyunsoonleella flava]